MSAGQADHVSARIPGAVRREITGLIDGYSWADPVANGILLDEAETFLRSAADSREPEAVFATYLFTDIVGSTERAAELGDRAWDALLQQHHALVRRRIAQFRGVEVGSAGDGFFATFDGPGRAIRCGCALRDDVRSIGLEIRVGVHAGEARVVEGQVSGISVHTAARVAAQAGAGEVLVSSTVRDLVAGSDMAFADRGVRVLKGVPGEWRLFLATCPPPTTS
jgi:class 3 adenylate cyclase